MAKQPATSCLLVFISTLCLLASIVSSAADANHALSSLDASLPQKRSVTYRWVKRDDQSSPAGNSEESSQDLASQSQPEVTEGAASGSSTSVAAAEEAPTSSQQSPEQQPAAQVEQPAPSPQPQEPSETQAQAPVPVDPATTSPPTPVQAGETSAPTSAASPEDLSDDEAARAFAEDTKSGGASVPINPADQVAAPTSPNVGSEQPSQPAVEPPPAASPQPEPAAQSQPEQPASLAPAPAQVEQPAQVPTPEQPVPEQSAPAGEPERAQPELPRGPVEAIPEPIVEPPPAPVAPVEPQGPEASPAPESPADVPAAAVEVAQAKHEEEQPAQVSAAEPKQASSTDVPPPELPEVASPAEAQPAPKIPEQSAAQRAEPAAAVVQPDTAAKTNSSSSGRGQANTNDILALGSEASELWSYQVDLESCADSLLASAELPRLALNKTIERILELFKRQECSQKLAMKLQPALNKQVKGHVMEVGSMPMNWLNLIEWAGNRVRCSGPASKFSDANGKEKISLQLNLEQEFDERLLSSRWRRYPRLQLDDIPLDLFGSSSRGGPSSSSQAIGGSAKSGAKCQRFKFEAGNFNLRLLSLKASLVFNVTLAKLADSSFSSARSNGGQLELSQVKVDQLFLDHELFLASNSAAGQAAASGGLSSSSGRQFGAGPSGAWLPTVQIVHDHNNHHRRNNWLLDMYANWLRHEYRGQLNRLLGAPLCARLNSCLID